MFKEIHTEVFSKKLVGRFVIIMPLNVVLKIKESTRFMFLFMWTLLFFEMELNSLKE